MERLKEALNRLKEFETDSLIMPAFVLLISLAGVFFAVNMKSFFGS